MEKTTRLKRVIAPIDAWVIEVQAVIYPYPRARRLKAIADWVNANPVLGLRATASTSSYSTDRKIGRLRWPGKGREGVEIKLFSTDPGTQAFIGGMPLKRHNSAETYRHNFEVERWLADWIARLPAAKRRKISLPTA